MVRQLKANVHAERAGRRLVGDFDAVSGRAVHGRRGVTPIGGGLGNYARGSVRVEHEEQCGRSIFGGRPLRDPHSLLAARAIRNKAGGERCRLTGRRDREERRIASPAERNHAERQCEAAEAISDSTHDFSSLPGSKKRSQAIPPRAHGPSSDTESTMLTPPLSKSSPKGTTIAVGRSNGKAASHRQGPRQYAGSVHE